MGHVHRSARRVGLALALAVSGPGLSCGGDAAALGAYHIEPGSLTVSGVSSGAYMAHQFHVAYSASVAGAAIIAGGPYHCAESGYASNLWHALTVCMDFPLLPYRGPPAVDPSIEAVQRRSATGAIDAPGNLRSDRVYLFSGTLDEFVPQGVMDTLEAFYQAFVAADNIRYVNDMPAAHGMLTTDYGNPACDAFAKPWINDCDYDMAGALLQHLYGRAGELATPVAQPSQTLLGFDQTPFGGEEGAPGLAPTGYVYVPRSCAAGAVCRLHVAFHGCLQQYEEIGDAFVAHAGYNRWAEANDIIVLYPQTRASYWGPLNPAGCWDWLGFSGPDYDTQRGRQLAAVRAMITRLSGGQETRSE